MGAARGAAIDREAGRRVLYTTPDLKERKSGTDAWQTSLRLDSGVHDDNGVRRTTSSNHDGPSSDSGTDQTSANVDDSGSHLDSSVGSVADVHNRCLRPGLVLRELILTPPAWHSSAHPSFATRVR